MALLPSRNFLKNKPGISCSPYSISVDLFSLVFFLVFLPTVSSVMEIKKEKPVLSELILGVLLLLIDQNTTIPASSQTIINSLIKIFGIPSQFSKHFCTFILNLRIRTKHLN